MYLRLLALSLALPGLGLAEPVVEAPEPILPDPDAQAVALPPSVVTEPSPHDTDDPAIWVHPTQPEKSLILGTDKDHDGSLLVYGLDGKIQWSRSIRGLLRPNNVDLAYGVDLAGAKVDVAVVTERFANRLRVFRVPEMAAIDGGGLPVFANESAREPMGVALYSRKHDNALFAIVSRAPEGSPAEGYLAQYQIADNGHGVLEARFVRNFGRWSGKKEIEALAVDSELGFVYAADERFGIRKYHADPDHAEANVELALFGTEGFSKDREGISIYPTGPGQGYLIISNQASDTFRVFPRQGTAQGPHDHPLITSVRVSTRESDGSDVTARALPGFPRGLFVAMSTDRTFHFYDWSEMEKVIRLAPAKP